MKVLRNTIGCFFLVVALSVSAQHVDGKAIEAIEREWRAQKRLEYEQLLLRLADTMPESVTHLELVPYGSDLPDMKRFCRLKTLRIAHLETGKIKREVFASDSLTSVRIENCSVESIRFPKNKHIEEVTITGSSLKRMPRTLKRCKNLKFLVLESNQIRRIPCWVRRCDSFKVLNLNYNQVKLNRAAARRLSKIDNLQLGGNGIESLPSNIGRLRVEYLNLGKNQLSGLPRSFARLSKLTHLIFYQNDFDSIPREIGQLKKLKELDLYKNHIREIPDFIGSLDQLEQLYLSFNEISVLPDTLHNLRRLKYFYVHHNRLLFAPEWMARMDSLQRVGLDYNRLLAIPDFSNLPVLEELDLSDNDLEEFPWELVKNNKLQIIGLRNNPFLLTPEEKSFLKQQPRIIY